MDTVIRGARISERAVILGVRRPAPPAAEAAAKLHAAEPVAGLHPVGPAPDPARLDAERRTMEEELRRELEARVEDAAAEARGRGREEGLELGKAEALREAREQRAAALRVLAEVAKRAEGQLEGMHDLMVAIAFEAVCKVLGARALDREVVAAMVHEVVSRVKQDEAILVRLHPQDCALMRDLAADAEAQREFKVELVADDKIAFGGCIVEADGGVLDARIETQMERLRAALLKARRAAGAATGPST
jgi:flagellar biosynthesis/type III secretory pathway protein FliH